LTRRAPRPLGPALDALLARVAPASTLGAVQGAWQAAVGAAVASHARPVGERDGILTVVCDEAVWAHEIELMGPELVAAINAALGRRALSALKSRSGAAGRPRSPRRRKPNMPD
jgi:predicted nucleic acid-binding Zn ribbon protein